uniref:Kinesin family member C1 n=2 Tax=Nothobranchius TaxID=28779 RepID=A0A1A8KNB0_NOTKU
MLSDCDHCQRVGPPLKVVETLDCIKVSGVWELVGIDLTGPLPQTPSGYKYILTATDYFSKWVEAFPLKTKSAEEVYQNLCTIFYRHGCPLRILTDQGREFVNQINSKLCELLSVERSVTAAYQPQTNGLDEKTNDNIKRALRKVVNERQDDWDLYLDATLFSLRSKMHTTTKFSPFYLMYGREARFPCELPVEMPQLQHRWLWGPESERGRVCVSMMPPGRIPAGFIIAVQKVPTASTAPKGAAKPPAATKAGGTGAPRRQAWDLKGKVSDMEGKIRNYQTKVRSVNEENELLKGSVAQSRNRLSDLLWASAAMKLSVQESTVTRLQTSLTNAQEEVRTLKETVVEQKDELHAGEMERRRLHNMIQELKGNIRVFCRVRPLVDGGLSRHIQLAPSDNKSITLAKTEESHTGKSADTQKIYHFSFDQVFGPHASQQQIFEEISLLEQSALDGYNVCCFAYGQTGSGKTYTMEGEEFDDGRGVIPRAVQQIFRAGKKLESQGWEFSFTASFVEIYNETLRDLLYTGKSSKRPKHEIRKSNNNEVTVTNLTYKQVCSEGQVLDLIALAKQNRSTAQTLQNDRSSRSHSVFQLQIEGANAGRDVRNSKLTYLLQGCLGGNSKTLMFVNISPEPDSFGETLNSLSFASKVNDCVIGTASSNRK